MVNHKSCMLSMNSLITEKHDDLPTLKCQNFSTIHIEKGIFPVLSFVQQKNCLLVWLKLCLQSKRNYNHTVTIKTEIPDIFLRRVKEYPSSGTQSQNIEKPKSLQVIDSVKFENKEILKHWKMLTRFLFQTFHLPKYSIIFCVLFQIFHLSKHLIIFTLYTTIPLDS